MVIINNNKVVGSTSSHKLHLAVLTALPLLALGVNAYAVETCTNISGVVTCTGSIAGGASNGAMLIAPTDYPLNSTSTIRIGHASTTDDSSYNDINAITGLSALSRYSTFNLGSGVTTGITLGTAKDTSTTLLTGLAYAPQTHGLANYEGINLFAADTKINNFGTITNVYSGSDTTPSAVAGLKFYVSAGKSLVSADGDTIPARTVGVWLNGSGTTLNNYGIITLAQNVASTADATNNVTVKSNGTGGGSSAVTNLGTYVLGTDKPQLYAVVATNDGDEMFSNVKLNNYNKIGVYSYGLTSAQTGTPVAIEFKENIRTGYISNAKGAVVEAVADYLTTKVTNGASTNGAATLNSAALTNQKFTTATGARGIATDNNSIDIYVNNSGTFASAVAAGTITAGAYTVDTSHAYGTAMVFSNANTYLSNNKSGQIFGDITIGNQANTASLINAGYIKGNIIITPDKGDGGSILASTGLANTSGSLYVAADGTQKATPISYDNKISISPIILAGTSTAATPTTAGFTGDSMGNSNALNAGYIDGGIYIATTNTFRAGDTTTNASGHHFILEIAPVVAAGVIAKDGQTYQYAAQNISIDGSSKETVNGVARQIDASNIIVKSTALVDWKFVGATTANATTATNTYQLVSRLKSLTSIAGLTAQSTVVLSSVLNANNGIGNQVQNLNTADDVVKAGKQLSPEANNASTQAVMSAVNQVSSVIGVHQDQVRLASKSGVSSGESAKDVGFWMQGFGFKGEQNQRGGVDGYSASTGGFIFGADSGIGNGDLRLGAALAYGTTTVDGQGVTTANRTNINSYQGTVYGSWDAGNWYADAALGYGQHQYNTKRYVALAGANMSGDHDADQYSAKLGLGYPLAMGRVIVTPLAAVSYVHLNQAGYSESDATNSGAALIIGNTKTDSVRSGLGAKVALPLSAGTVKTAVEARALWNHEFADTNQDIAARFAAGTSFTTNGVSQARDSANLGLGLNMNSDNGQTFSVNYDAEVRSSYTGHTASIKFRYNL